MLGPPVTQASPGSQWFDVVAYDYGFWVTDTRTGANDTGGWDLYEGWTVTINATSYPPDPAVGGVNAHGVGIYSNSLGTLVSVAAPVGSWSQGSFVVPFVHETGDQLYCTTYCGPGHGSMSLSIVDLLPAPASPVASASGSPTNGTSPFTVDLVGGASGGSPPYSYAWNFGDGAVATTQDPAHTYTLAGSFRAVLTVTDSAGGEAQAYVPVQVTPPAPLAATISASPPSGTVPLLVSLLASPTGGQPPYAILWSFGDGSTGSGAATNHTYTTAGSYLATATVHDALGNTASVSTSVVASDPVPLLLTVSADRTGGPAWLHVNLTATPSGGTAPYAATWDFGDGTTGQGTSIEHLYRSAGTFVPSVTVLDATGRSGTANGPPIDVTGSFSGPLTLSVAATPSRGPTPLNVTTTASVSGGSGGYTVTWDFGDGSAGSGVQATHRYTSGGTFTIRATVRDSSGGTASGSTTVTALGLEVALLLNRTSGDGPLPVEGTVSISGGAGGYLPVRWDWGDGSPAEGCTSRNCTTAVHIYQPPARNVSSFPVRVTVVDAAGENATANATMEVHPPPSGSLTYTVAGSGSPFHVHFNLSLAGGSGTFPSPYLWNFGDGTTERTGPSASEVYLRGGNYSAFVMVEDSFGVQLNVSLLLDLSVALHGLPSGSSTSYPSHPWTGLGSPTSTGLGLLGLLALGALVILGPERPPSWRTLRRFLRQGKPRRPRGAP